MHFSLALVFSTVLFSHSPSRSLSPSLFFSLSLSLSLSSLSSLSLSLPPPPHLSISLSLSLSLSLSVSPCNLSLSLSLSLFFCYTLGNMIHPFWKKIRRLQEVFQITRRVEFFTRVRKQQADYSDDRARRAKGIL